MAQCKIVWSHRARIRLLAILEFYVERNKSKTYSTRLFARFNREIKLLAKYPELGVKTEMDSVRALIVDEHIIYYEHQQNTIIIHTIWNSRQDPESLIIK